MSGQEQRAAPGIFDEIAELAQQHLLLPDGDGLREIERQCQEAVGEGRWDDLGKWHRVRLRYLRYRNQQAGTGRASG